MAENIQKIKTRYPFGGFYLELLPEAERKELESMPEEVLLPEPPTTTELPNAVPPAESASIKPVPQQAGETAPPDTISVPAKEEARLAAVVPEASEEEHQPAEEPCWMSDLIGDEFKQWESELVAIEAMTGTGKTTFVLGPMLKWCVDECQRTGGMRFEKILYLCNRAPLREELIDALNKAGVPNTRVDGYDVVTLVVYEDDAHEFSVMKVSTYQRYEEFLAKDPVRARREIQRYSYIVCDEAQYFFTDASFNENTILSYRTIMAARNHATVIAMTATPENMFTAWMKKGRLAKNRYYYLPKKMSHIKKALIYSNDLEREKLLAQIPEGEKTLVLINDWNILRQLKDLYGDAVGCYCSVNNSRGPIDALEDCIKDGKLQKRIVFTTEVLYNGISIKDKTLKHIFIETWEPLKIIQMQGRKRPVDETDTCTVYYRAPSRKQLAKKRDWNQYDLDTAEAWLDYEHEKPGKWNAILAQKDAQERIERCKALTYIHAKDAYQLNPMLVNNMRQMRDLLDALYDHGYRATMQERVWDKTLQVSPREYRDEVIADYITHNFCKEMSKQELRTGLAEAGLYKPGKRPIGQNILNGKLKKYHVQIGTITSKCRVNGKSTTLTYWLLMPDHP
ncbi:DEAD/DEAH box helicase family protein [uncultured Gemmiger sp.]|uniref:DEAD/DEAH box helicase family protein n=1 Tax=uncultured Gemmiger sp. TaxID=1623490 RepID=UPI002629B675|nr:DEAD/DEAH box helicase family protein [uncultured Gemmiger sp.]